MTEHRGRFVALLVGLLLAGLAVTADPGAAVARKARAHVIHTAADSLAGRGMWIWYISRSAGGTLSSIIATAKQYGVSTLIIKSGDGSSMWSQFNSSVVSTLHANGLRACAWQYVYGVHPISEAYVGAQAVHDGADCLVIDAESEYEGKYVQAQSYITRLRQLIGQSYPVVLAGFPYVDYHPGFPYSVFLGPGGAQYNSPQMYWMDIGTSVNAVYAHTYAYNGVYERAIDPLGQVYQNPPMGQIIRFRQLSRDVSRRGRELVELAAGEHDRVEGNLDRCRQPDRHHADREHPGSRPRLAWRPRRLGAGAPGDGRLHDPDRRRLRPGHAIGRRGLPVRGGTDGRRDPRAGHVGGAAPVRARAGDVDAHGRCGRLRGGRAHRPRRTSPAADAGPEVGPRARDARRDCRRRRRRGTG